METEILEELKIELQNEPGFSEEILKLKIKNAIREVKQIRRYPKAYTETYIDSDLLNYYAIVKDVALYDYNMLGAEGEAGHSENGISRTYIDRNKLFSGVIPIAKL